MTNHLATFQSTKFFAISFKIGDMKVKTLGKTWFTYGLLSNNQMKTSSLAFYQ